MGRNNRARRAAKQRDRRRAAAGPEAASARFPHGAAPVPPAVALLAAARCRCADAERHAVELLGEYRHVGSELDIAADAVLTSAVRGAWTAGWAPTDLQELARRVLEPTAAGLLLEHIVVESRTYAGATLHPRWRAALDAVAAGVGHEITDGPRLRSWVARTGDGRVEVLAALLRVLTVLDGLPVLERLVPLPGLQRHESEAGGHVDRKVLVRVRALLAKAESTEFPDEAEALSAKAQELMSRYSLGQAVLEHDSGRAPAAAGRRLWMEAPYAGAKVLLVQAVATANRCRTVWREDPGFVTVVGPDTELDIVELLTTSLLLQASRAMLAAGRQVSRSGTSRTRSFRQSFLVAYAGRIGERLEAASRAATAEVTNAAGTSGSALLPVLAARSEAADEMIEQLFPRMVSRAVSMSNAAGWHAGRAAADLAQLDVRSSIAG
jgi:hypothetical protein